MVKSDSFSLRGTFKQESKITNKLRASDAEWNKDTRASADSVIDGTSVGEQGSPVQRWVDGWVRRWESYEGSARLSEDATAAPR